MNSFLPLLSLEDWMLHIWLQSTIMANWIATSLCFLVTRNKMGWKISEISFELLEGKPGVFKGISVCECSVWFPLA